MSREKTTNYSRSEITNSQQFLHYLSYSHISVPRQIYKYLLVCIQQIKIQVALLKDCIENYGGNENSHLQYEKNKFQLKVLTDSMLILSGEEKFVIEMHLIQHHTWIETEQLFSELHGKINEKSERTLKRIQNRALKKILNFINNLPIQDCFNE